MKASIRVGLLLLALFAVGLLVVGVASDVSAKPGGHAPKILEWDVMIGVPRPYTGPDNAIRGIPGGGQPWVVERARGELRTDGTLEIRVQGLVLERTGANPAASFGAIVSCLSTDADGEAIVVNVPTNRLFPADMNGDAHIEDEIALPDPCIAPIVFVTSPGGSWFAASGF
jgi:hypothetical protein